MKKNNEKAVSIVIGVILMVAIVIAIAITVYYYVETSLINEPQITGNITDKQKYYDRQNNPAYYFIVDYHYIVRVDKTTYDSYDINDLWNECPECG